MLAERCMAQIVPLADWVICNEEDASDVFGITAPETSVEAGRLNAKGYESVARRLLERFPKLSLAAITLRESCSADHNNWGECSSTGNRTGRTSHRSTPTAITPHTRSGTSWTGSAAATPSAPD
ncbi:MAG: hypothetical protein L6W00_09920 [Lentisphaeria bacterium]|nr:MAG: hypothetical protein L6W00_09920 [Lentisphaeria bacterium]